MKTKEEILEDCFGSHQRRSVEYCSPILYEQILNALEKYSDQQTAHLTDQIKSMEERIVKIRVEHFKEMVAVQSQLEALQKEKQSDAVEFTEWINKGYYYWSPADNKWIATKLIDASPLKNYKAIKSRKTTRELYELFKTQTPSQINN